MIPIYLLIAIPFLLGLVAFEIILDRWKGKKIFGFHDTLTNLSCGIGNQALNLFVNVLMVGLYILLFENFALWQIPPTWWSFVLCLLVFDLAFYWEHRLSHEINILWGTHVVHHSSEEFNLSVALRRSWIANLVVIVFFLPIPIMGFDLKIFLATVAVHNIYQFVLHTKAVGKLPWLVELIMHTPSHHRVHHGRDPKYIDRNYSGVFIIYDRMFGTFQEEEEEPTYGITTPVNANNPGRVNLHYYQFLFHQIRHMKGWRNKLKMLFARPGWFPEEMGGFQAPQEVDKATFAKYRPNSPRALNRYVLVQFLLAFSALVVLIITTLNAYTLPFQIAFLVAVIGSSIIPIALFDGKKWSRRAEDIRLISVFLILMAYAFFHVQAWFLPISIALVIVYFINKSWFQNIKAKYFYN